MIDLYTWGTPNGRKVSIMLEETALAYDVHPINIIKDEQFTPHFLSMNPNNKIPVIVDQDGPGGAPLTLFESGAILVYLAEKTGQFLSDDPRRRAVTMQWLMFQMGGFGPILGQSHHFMRFAKEQVPYAVERFGAETGRLYGVLNKHLSDRAYLAGDDYSIADMATFPWVARHEWHQIDVASFPNVQRWYDKVGERAAVQRGMAVPAA